MYTVANDHQRSILKTLSVPAAVAQLLLSPISHVDSLDPDLEESLWQACDYNQMVTFVGPVQPVEETPASEPLADEWPISPGLMELLGRGFPPSDFLTWSEWDPSTQAIPSDVHDLRQHPDANVIEAVLPMDV